MKTWYLRAVDRESGVESEERVVAVDERSAFQAVSERGKVVSGVIEVVDGPSTPLGKPPARKHAKPEVNPRRHADDRCYFATAVGWLCILGGVVLALMGWLMDTSRSGTHNIGLLNEQLVKVIVGGVLMIVGSITVSAAAILLRLPIPKPG